jgi:3-hydroxypropanoate dehydrogenase
MHAALDDNALDQLFREARTLSQWLDRPVAPDTLQRIYELARMGPTSANCQPGRLVFVVSPAAKERLRPCLNSGNVAKTMAAPATVIVAQDLEFYEKLPRLYLHEDARSWFAGKENLIRETAFRNSTLQGAYVILAARALGLDCGPMSGFKNALVDEAFFAGSSIKSNFLINLGYGDASSLHPRNPRLTFEEACRID